jgi:hypothetical protein
MIDNKSGLGLGFFGRHVVGNMKGKIENIASGGKPIAWCG